MKVGNYETLYDKLWLRKRDKSVTACNIPTWTWAESNLNEPQAELEVGVVQVKLNDVHK